MRRWGLAVLFVIGAATASNAVAQLPDRPVSNAQLLDAIDRLKKDLYDRQDQQTGTWQAKGEPASYDFGGTTALAVNALLASGETPQNPRLARAIEFLKGAQLTGTYAVAVRAHVWALLPKAYLPLLERDALWLLGAHDGRSRFRYTAQPVDYDHSATQYALLGLWEAAKRNVTIPDRFWLNAQHHFLRVQNPDGGWGYLPANESKASMVAAGLTALHITRQQLERRGIKPPDDLPKARDDAMRWLDRHFDPRRNLTASGGDGGHLHYYLYSVERVAMAGGVKFLGDKDWFHQGARTIIDQFDKPARGVTEEMQLVRSAFSLMFLARGRVGVWITKLQVPGQATNNRPDDVNRLTAYLSNVRETELNWQTVSLNRPTDDFLNSPVAWLAGVDDLELTDQQRGNLKGYIDRGGLLLVCPEGGSNRFRRSLRTLAGRLYPQWAMRPADSDHPVYRALYRINRTARPVMTVSNGARDLILVADHDWGRTFHHDNRPGNAPAWKLAANVFTFATGRGDLPGRLERAAQPRQVRQITGRMTVGRVSIKRPAVLPIVEPALWPSVADYFFNRTGIVLEVVDVELDKIAGSDLPLLHLAGVDQVKLTEQQLLAVADYTRRGGTILVETIGGRGKFAAAIAGQLSQQFQNGPAPLPAGSSLLTGEALTNGHDVRRVEYRRHAATGPGKRNRLIAVTVDGRPAVIISREDLSLGVLGLRHVNIFGYKPESARRIVTNILLWANAR